MKVFWKPFSAHFESFEKRLRLHQTILEKELDYTNAEEEIFKLALFQDTRNLATAHIKNVDQETRSTLSPKRFDSHPINHPHRQLYFQLEGVVGPTCMADCI